MCLSNNQKYVDAQMSSIMGQSPCLSLQESAMEGWGLFLVGLPSLSDSE